MGGLFPWPPCRIAQAGGLLGCTVQDAFPRCLAVLPASTWPLTRLPNVASPKGEDFQARSLLPPHSASLRASDPSGLEPVQIQDHIARGACVLDVVIRRSTFRDPLVGEDGNHQTNPNSRSLPDPCFSADDEGVRGGEMGVARVRLWLC